MKIRNASGAAGQAGDAFIAVDDLENRLGSGRVEMSVYKELMPQRPCDIRLVTEGDESARMQLLGTALTRGLMLAKESGLNARIYAECAPGDQALMEAYRSIGLIDDDALVRMSRRVVAGPNVVRLPEGFVLVEDDLTDAQERAFFLDRQRTLFGRENAEAWLEEAGKKPLFRRLLLVSREGLAGELLCWKEPADKMASEAAKAYRRVGAAQPADEGVIALVYTAPHCRRKGVATRLMEAARQYFFKNRLEKSHVDVRLSMQHMMRLAGTAGYRQERVLMRLPGMNLPGRSMQ